MNKRFFSFRCQILIFMLCHCVGWAEERVEMASIRVIREAEMVHQGRRLALELEMPVWVYPEGRSLDDAQREEMKQLLKDLESYLEALQKLSQQAEDLSTRWSSLMFEATPFHKENGDVR